tara:strand:+ start:1456 stop:2022 length:567 start_codon:yes stop_codon:yes gene_type:complete
MEKRKINKNNLPKWSEVHTIVFDFDGIFTNNKVLVSQDGNESVICDRSDGLGLDILRKFIKIKNWNLDYYILSTETNNVVAERAKKMKINCYFGVNNKYEFISKRVKEKELISHPQKKLVFLGNDINDLEAMNLADFSIAPKDSHHRILKVANRVINLKGGNGFVRKFIEDLIEFDQMSIDEINKLIN